MAVAKVSLRLFSLITLLLLEVLWPSMALPLLYYYTLYKESDKNKNENEIKTTLKEILKGSQFSLILHITFHNIK